VSRSRVAIARGGTSIEREVSRRGARRVSAALRAGGHEVMELEIDHTVVDRVRELAPDYVFIAAHGRGGEDGSLQALLELLRIPYTGSDSLASALCLDKILAKRMLVRAGLTTPPFHAFSRRTFQELGAAAAFDDVLARLGAPVVVKPARLGSAFGIKYVQRPEQLRTAVLGAVAYDDEILVERHVAGRELAVTVLGGPDPAGPGAAGELGAPVPYEALPIVEIPASDALYDYEAHYDVDVVRLDAPAALSAAERALVEGAAIGACRALGTRDVARVDLILESAAPAPRAQILEVNTIPGLTETGPTPLAAEAAGLGFAGLIERIGARAATAASIRSASVHQ
jgi:D-alanine-D-alanine ligase